MAQFQNDPFPGTDYTKYLEWAKVTTPDGNTFYEVPGHPGYVLDPIASNATGRKVFRANPKGKVEEYEAQKKAQEQAQFMQGPVGQILPIVAGTGGLIAANQLIPAPTDPLKEYFAKKIIAEDAAKAVTSQAQAAAQGATNATTSNATSLIPSSTPTVEPLMSVDPSLPANQVASVDPNLANNSSGFWTTEAPANGSLGQIAGAAMAAKGIYDAAKGWDNGGKGLRAGLTETGGGLGTVFGGPIGGAVGTAYGNILGYGLQGSGWKNKVALAATQPWLLAFPGLRPHKTTRQVAQEHTKELQETSPEDTNWQNYVTGMRTQYNEAPIDPSKPFAGKYESWDAYKQGGLEAGDLTGVYGNLKAFGPEWANLTQEQRQAVTQGLIDNNLYDSKKGEVIITDEKKAQDVKNNILKGFQVGQATAKPVAVAPVPAVNQATLPNNVTPVNVAPTSPGSAAAQGYFRKIPIKVKGA